MAQLRASLVLVATIIWHGFIFVHADLDTSPYSPSSNARTYHQGTLETNTDYVTTLSKKAAPIFAVGVAFLLALMIWSCARLCGHCKPKSLMRKWIKHSLAVGIVLCICGCGVIIFFGFAEQTKLASALTDVNSVLTDLGNWNIVAGNKVTNCSNQVSNTLNLLGELQAIDSSDTAEISAMTTNLIAINLGLTDVRNTVNNIKLASTTNKVSNYISSSKKWCQPAVLGTFGLILGFMLAQAILFYMDTHCKRKDCQPSKRCCCVPATFSFVFVLLTFLVWFIAGVLFMATTGTADFCMDPASTMLSIAGNNADVAYYLKCDQPGNTLTNPTASATTSLETQYSSAMTHLDNMDAAQPVTCGNQNCLDIKAKLAQIRASMGVLRSALGTSPSTNNADDGLYGQVSCAGVNNIFRAFEHTLCDSSLSVLVRLFQGFIVFGAVMLLLEVFKRLAPKRADVTAAREAQRRRPSFAQRMTSMWRSHRGRRRVSPDATPTGSTMELAPPTASASTRSAAAPEMTAVVIATSTTTVPTTTAASRAAYTTHGGATHEYEYSDAFGLAAPAGGLTSAFGSKIEPAPPAYYSTPGPGTSGAAESDYETPTPYQAPAPAPAPVVQLPSNFLASQAGATGTGTSGTLPEDTASRADWLSAVLPDDPPRYSATFHTASVIQSPDPTGGEAAARDTRREADLEMVNNFTGKVVPPVTGDEPVAASASMDDVDEEAEAEAPATELVTGFPDAEAEADEPVVPEPAVVESDLGFPDDGEVDGDDRLATPPPPADDADSATPAPVEDDGDMATPAPVDDEPAADVASEIADEPGDMRHLETPEDDGSAGFSRDRPGSLMIRTGSALMDEYT